MQAKLRFGVASGQVKKLDQIAVPEYGRRLGMQFCHRR